MAVLMHNWVLKMEKEFTSLKYKEKNNETCGVIQHVCYHHVIEEMHCLGILRLNRSKLAEDFFQVH